MSAVDTPLASRIMSDGDDIFARINKRVAELGISEGQVGIQAGRSRDLLRSMRRGLATGDRKGIGADTLAAIAPVLRTSVEWLLTGKGVEDTGEFAEEDVLDDGRAIRVDEGIQPGTVPEGAIAEPVAPIPVHIPPSHRLTRDLPIHGTAMGSIIGNMEGTVIERDIVDHVRRPPALEGNAQAYGLYVRGHSMHPLHKHGELRLVDPKKRPQIDDSVVVLTKTNDHDPGQHYIKILKKRTLNALVLEQLNPPATMTIPLKYVVAVHKVLTMDDLFAI